MRLLACVFSALAAWLALIASPLAVHAEPLVRVRGESRIELGVAHTELGLGVTGALRDELGMPLGSRALAIEAVPLTQPLDPWRSHVTTDAEGRFALEIPDPEHDYRLLATFSGDETHRGVRVERRVERARSDVRLELRLPLGHTIDLDAPELVIEAIAESDIGGQDVVMRLSDEAGRELARGTTDRSGHLRVRVPTSRLGAAGAGLVRIESLRDARRAEAQTEARVVRKRAVFVELSLRSAELEAGQPAQVLGRVHTRAGPRGRAPVGLFAGTRHLATVMTDPSGQFEAELWLDSDRGSVEITARVEGDATGAYPSAEARTRVRVLPARPVPVLWLLAVSSAVLLAVVLSTRRRARSSGAERSEPRLREPTEPSISPARAHGRRDRHNVSGTVIDLRSERAVADARIVIEHSVPSAACALQTDAEGRFESASLPNGRARVRIVADGYVGTELDIELPHRGEWSAVVVRLESLRARALAAFRTLALRALPSTRAWGIWTAREVREWLAERAPGQRTVIRQLTKDVERACYAREAPAPEAVARIEQSAADVTAELRVRNASSARERRTAR